MQRKDAKDRSFSCALKERILQKEVGQVLASHGPTQPPERLGGVIDAGGYWPDWMAAGAKVLIKQSTLCMENNFCSFYVYFRSSLNMW